MGCCVVALLLAMATPAGGTQQADLNSSRPEKFDPASYSGFDRNGFPGDAALPALRRSFRFTGYWLNPPPGETANTWMGKRTILRKYGFGFLVLFGGRTDAELKAAGSNGLSAGALGTADGKAAVAAAGREGFPPNVLIFLDQEEGGRLLPEQSAYLFAWVDAVRVAGARAGVYCSGISVPEGNGTISTAQDIVERESARESAKRSSPGKSRKGQRETPESRLALWIANDQCPPAPGCTLAAPPLASVFSPPVLAFATVWQYAQSPRRAQFSASCPPNQAADGNCYAPGLPANARIFVDLDTASSPNPSEAPR